MGTSRTDILFMTMIGVMMGAVVMIAEITLRSLFYGGGRRSSRTSDRGGGQGQLVLLAVALLLMISPRPGPADLPRRLAEAGVPGRRVGARFTRYPRGWPAPWRRSPHAARLKAANKVTAPMYIVNPLQGPGRPPLSTHRRWRRASASCAAWRRGGFAAYDQAYRR